MPVTATKYTDYSNSAIALNNPIELESLLQQLAILQEKQLAANKELQEKNPEIFKRIEETTLAMVTLKKDIQDVVDRLGSYQDLERGRYALKQKRVSLDYKPALVKVAIPANLLPAVIIESVNVKALEGLHKGGLVTREQMEASAEAKESYAYIIKTS